MGGQTNNGYSYQGFIYLDTNIFSELAKHVQKEGLFSVEALKVYLIQTKMAIALSENHLSELSSATRLHWSLALLLTYLPSVLIHSTKRLIDYEIEAYPQSPENMTEKLVAKIILFSDLGDIFKLFSSDFVLIAREKQRIQSQQIADEHERLSKHFLPDKSGKYTRKQTESFAETMTNEEIHNLHLPFLHQCHQNHIEINYKNFKGLWLRAATIFYKYYLGKRKPKRTSDLADFSHVYYLPYCNLVVMEKDLCNILKQIKRNHNILENVQLENITFVRDILKS